MTGRQATTSQQPGNLILELRSRTRDKNSGEFQEIHSTVCWNPQQTAIIICDMWDDHPCKGAAERVAELAPAMNRAISEARDTGVFIIHAPAGTVSVYEDTPQRRRAVEAPFVESPVEIKSNHWNRAREGEPLPQEFGTGGCGCRKPCSGWIENDQGVRCWEGGKSPKTRQIETIKIASEDAISDSGQEIYNLMQSRNIDNVILIGVHTNICVLGRPFGLRQMVYFGKNVVLCRDLTDSIFRSPSPDFSHFHGTDLIVEHIEKHWCPTVTSDRLVGGEAFRFRKDTREHL